MRLPTLEELESLGFIKDITTPRQLKNGTMEYIDTDPLSPYYKIKLWIHKDKNTGKIIYKDTSTLAKVIPDEKSFIYRVINNRLFRVPKEYAGNKDKKYYVCEYPATTKGVRTIIDNMSEEEFKARIKWLNKIYGINRLYKEDGYGPREQSPMAAKLIGPFKMESN